MKWPNTPEYMRSRLAAFDALQDVLVEKCAGTKYDGQPPGRVLSPLPSEARTNQVVYRAARFAHGPTFIEDVLRIFGMSHLGSPAKLFHYLNAELQHPGIPTADIPEEKCPYLMLAGPLGEEVPATPIVENMIPILPMRRREGQ